MKLPTPLVAASRRLTRSPPSTNPTNSRGGSRRFRRIGGTFGLLALVAVFVLGVGTGAALLLSNQAPTEDSVETGPQLPGDSSPEAGFARDMMVHHAQAVQMADIVRDKTQSMDIRIMAKTILLNQQAEIGQMRGWLQVWGVSDIETQPHMAWMDHPTTEDRMPGMASAEEMGKLQDAASDESSDQMDTLFLQLMIPHHQAAIPMAEAILERTSRSEVKQLATAIIASQQEEIRQMQESLQSRGMPLENSLAPDTAAANEENPHHHPE